MKSYIKVIIYLLSFALIIAVATIGYKILANNYNQEEVSIEDNKKALKQANDFEVVDSEGNKVKLSDFFGKPIVVNFWATWCMPCKEELPEFEEAYKKYNQNIEFLMVNLTDGYNDTVDSAKKFIKENNYDFPLYFDTEYSASNTYKIYSIPQTLFIDKDGNILQSYKGMISNKTLEKYIERLLGE